MANRLSGIEIMSTKPTFIENIMQSLMFTPLSADGTNFLEWVNDAKTVLSADDLARTLSTTPSTSTDLAQ